MNECQNCKKLKLQLIDENIKYINLYGELQSVKDIVGLLIIKTKEMSELKEQQIKELQEKYG